MRFQSDNAAAVCPEVLAAVTAANVPGHAYDADPWSSRLDAVLSDWFGAPCRAFAVGTGTAANSLALAAICPPYGAVLCEQHAHINTDECGAPEFFGGGLKLRPVQGVHGKLGADALAQEMARLRGDVHESPVRALSLSQATESGTVYTPDEVAALAGAAKTRGWRVHMDGARFANALVHLGCHPGDVTWRAGVDALALGCIKNGGMGAEALVLFDHTLAEEIAFRRKRSGQTPSKGRFRAAELIAMTESGAWAMNATAANAGAARLAIAAGARLLHPVQANELFVNMGAEGAARLRAQGFEFYDWGTDGPHAARLVVAWDTPAREIDAMANALALL
jgi:threonine aldolase